MKTSSFIILIIAALFIGGGIAAVVLLSGSAQTQIIGPLEPCAITVTDSDGDCVDNTIDYYPFDELR